MTKRSETAAAELVFMGGREIDVVKIGNLLASGLEALGGRVEAMHVLSDHAAQIVCARFVLRISIAEDVVLPALPAPAALCLEAEILPRPRMQPVPDVNKRLLARLMRVLQQRLAPDFVRWDGSDLLLSGSDFARAVGGLPARTARRRGRHRSATCAKLPDIDETNEQLFRRIAAHDPLIMRNVSAPGRARKFLDAAGSPGGDAHTAPPAATAALPEEEDIETAPTRRLSAWLIAFAVALFALPVGIVLLILNLCKGENLRLASQTAAVTGTFIGLQAVGSTAQAMSALKSVLG